MAGKRLLDAAKLLNVGRSVAKQHIALRQQQWDVYNRTSSLTKVVKEQTDRVTVTAGAAYELAKRFNENGPSWQQSPSQNRQRGASSERSETSPPSRATSEGYNSREVQHGSNADEVAARNGTREGEVKPSSDADDGSLASLRSSKAQRLAERQIPVASASEQPPLEQHINQDTFSQRTDAVSPEYSSLSRMKIPKHAEKGSNTEENLSEKDINQDVHYTPGGQADMKENELPADVGGAFFSQRASRLAGIGGAQVQRPFERRQKLPPKPLSEMVTVEKQRKLEAETKASSTSEIGSETPMDAQRDFESKEVVTDTHDKETQDLAHSIAQEAEPEYAMHESRVPSSRFGRLWQYGGLVTSMAFGAVGESFRRMTGGSGEGSLMLSEGNMNRLVAKLSRMRGAALKLGQMMSFQDSKMLPPAINTVLQRVQDSADYMPPSQRNKVLVDNLGQNWRELFSNFEEKPFAAASIGQVHRATLASNGKDVAVKVQYPGVRNSIDSDLNNLALLLTASKILPKGLFLDKTIANMRVELGWECDYEREADACIRFQDLLKDETHVFTVPQIYKEASGPNVLTAEFMVGTAVTKMKDLSQHDRDWVGTQILRLCLRELMEWRFMQTDPNWTNFLYNRESQKLELLDFGASREYPDKFVQPYVSLLIAASKGDRDSCRDLSIQLGYLTGHEGIDMVNAHVDSVLTLAEPFVENAPKVYDFEDQTITDRVRANIGLMLRERQAPPPEETYSLHRKLSGAFLLCARLRSQVRAREMFSQAVEVWSRRATKIE